MTLRITIIAAVLAMMLSVQESRYRVGAERIDVVLEFFIMSFILYSLCLTIGWKIMVALADHWRALPI